MLADRQQGLSAGDSTPRPGSLLSHVRGQEQNTACNRAVCAEGKWAREYDGACEPQGTVQVLVPSDMTHINISLILWLSFHLQELMALGFTTQKMWLWGLLRVAPQMQQSGGQRRMQRLVPHLKRPRACDVCCAPGSSMPTTHPGTRRQS